MAIYAKQIISEHIHSKKKQQQENNCECDSKIGQLWNKFNCQFSVDSVNCVKFLNYEMS